MELTSKQRAGLRSMAHSLKPIFQVGKEGVSEVLAKEVLAALNKRELIKITVLETAGDPREVAELLASMTGAQVVAVTGFKVVLYRRADDEANRKIDLRQLF